MVLNEAVKLRGDKILPRLRRQGGMGGKGRGGTCCTLVPDSATTFDDAAAPMIRFVVVPCLEGVATVFRDSNKRHCPLSLM